MVKVKYWRVKHYKTPMDFVTGKDKKKEGKAYWSSL
jgi:hypothetical protein